MTTAIPTEEQEQATLFQWANANRHTFPELALLYAVPNGGYRSPVTAAHMKRTGVKRGVPDMCLPVPRKGKHGLYIELKRLKGGKVSPDQIRWMDDLNREGYEVALCCGWVEARNVIVEYLRGERV